MRGSRPPSGVRSFLSTPRPGLGLVAMCGLAGAIGVERKTMRWESSEMLSKFYLEEWIQGAGLSGIGWTVEFQPLA
jgi:hypothetical protein